MSIDNIFKCCKKNYVITGISGIFLGAYGSYYGLSSFLGPIYEAPIEVPPNPPPPTGGTVAEPVLNPVIVPLSAPITFGGLISNAAAMGSVALIGGLAVISFVAYKIVMARRDFQASQILREYTRLRNEGLLNQETVRRLRDELNDLRNNPKPPTREDFEKAGFNDKKVIKEALEDLENKRQELEFARDVLKNTYDEYLEVTKKDRFSFFGANKVITFLKGDNFEIDPEKEKEEIEEMGEKDQEKIESASNQLLAKLEGDARIFIETDLFTVYKKNIPGLEEGLKIEESEEVALRSVIIEGMYSAFGFKEKVSIEAMLTESVSDVQTNMAMNLATTAYDDFNNFIYYGAKQVIGTPIINFTPTEIIYKFSAINVVPLKINKFTYLNAAKGLTILKFQNNNFVSRLAMQYKIYFIPIFSRIVAAGIGRFDPLLAKWLHIVANNKFSTIVKINTVSSIYNFPNQFVDENVLEIKNKWASDIEYNNFKNLVMQETGSDSLKYHNIKKMAIIQDQIKTLYKFVINNVLQKRNAYVDFIKIYDKIYQFLFTKDYDIAIKELNGDLENNVNKIEVMQRSLTSKKF